MTNTMRQDEPNEGMQGLTGLGAGEGELPSDDWIPHLMMAVIESASDAIISKTLDGIIVSWNKSAERIFGYTAEEAIGRPVKMLIPADRLSEEDAILSKIRSGERIDHYETVRVRKDGSLIEVAVTTSPITGADGAIVGASKIVRDLSSLRRAERRGKASEERYRALFNSIDEGFCVIQMIYDEVGKAVDYRFLEVNPVFEQQTGLAEVQGRTMLDLVPGHEKSWFEIYGRVAETGEAIRFENYSHVLDRWFDLYAFRMGKPEDRTVAVVFSNVTERKRHEQVREALVDQLESEKAKLSYLFTHAPAFVASLRGPDHIFELANPNFMQLIGHRDVIEKSAREALPELQGQLFFEPLDSVYWTGKPFTGIELPIDLQPEPGATPEKHYLNFVYQPIFASDGTVSGIFAHGVDITEQVQARAVAEEANRAKDEFLATLSHELRTPLNAILGWASMLGDERLDSENKVRAVDAIQRNARTQAQLIEDILDVSRIVSGKLKLEVRPVDLSSVIEAAVDAVLPAAEAKSIRLQRVLDSGTGLISGDPDRLQQVVWNLLSNAIKFTPKGGRVQIRLERINSHVEIIVTDTGPGIAPEILPHIFERFRQADSSTTRQFGGLGLGLAIVRHLVEMHGGTVEAENAEGRGAILTVKLPLIALRSAEVSPFGVDRREHPTRGRIAAYECPPELEGVRVLVVDDEPDSRILVATVLGKCGAKVVTVESAESGIEALRSQKFDVLLSDIGMPMQDGYAFIKNVRALPAEQGGNIPAAALTAFARIEDRMRVLRSGYQTHLPKPVEPAELLIVVANLCGRHDLLGSS